MYIPLLFEGVGTASENKKTANNAVEVISNILGNIRTYGWLI